MDRKRCAIIGCGGYAGAHARRLKARPDVQIAALCSRSASSIEKLVARRLADYEPAPSRYTSTKEMYANENLDAVVVCTPHHLHLEQTVEAVRAGCHVLVEKPMVTSRADAEALASAVQKQAERGNRVVVGVCYNPAYSPALRHVREAVRDGAYGPLQLVSGYLAQNWKTLTAGSWRQDPEQSGGGQAMDSGAHLIHSLVSTVASRPVEVFAYSDTQGTHVDINTVITARFENGVMATITIGGNTAVDTTHTSYLFERGHIDVDAWKGDWLRSITADGEQDELSELGEPSPDDNFIDALLGKDELVVSLDDGLLVAAFTDAMYASIEHGRPVRVERPAGEGL
jgi:predicted dehydrogenase